MKREIVVIKKDGNVVDFQREKIMKAVVKSAERVLRTFTDAEMNLICENVEDTLIELGETRVKVEKLHIMVVYTLDELDGAVAKSY